MTPHDVRPDDPLVRWMVAPDHAKTAGDLSPARPCVSDGSNVAWLGRAARPGERWVTGVGEDPDSVVRLVTRIADEHEVDGVTVSASAFEHLPTRLRPPDPGRWSFWVLDEQAAAVGSAGAHALELDDPRILPLLSHSDSAHIFPGDPRMVRWSGIEKDGTLLSVAGQVTEASGAAHVLSVCTHPDARGQGLAREVCAHLIAAARADGAPAVVLEMYTANEAGRRTYTSLGFRECGRYASGLLASGTPTLRS
jgi:ribosomal protein S18 acetylase RimI-like enzyme